MAKSGNRIHGSLRARTATSFGKKAWLVDFMEDNGWHLERSDVVDSGEWNERRIWSAVNSESGEVFELGSNLGRMDWHGASIAFMSLCLSISHNEIDHIIANAA